MKLLKKHSVFVSCLLIIHSHALSCRSKYGPKDEELKRIFDNCQTQQQGNNSNSPYSSEQDRTERSYNHKNDYDRNSRSDNRDGRNTERDNMRDNYDNRSNGRNSRDQYNDSKRTENDRNNGDRTNRNSNSNGMEAGKRDRNEMKKNHNSHLNGQDDFLQSEEYGNRNYYSSPQPNLRYKREKKVEMNSGQRSQYSPHSQRSNENNSNEGNSSDNSTSKVACVLHCYLENLQMVTEVGVDWKGYAILFNQDNIKRAIKFAEQVLWFGFVVFPVCSTPQIYFLQHARGRWLKYTNKDLEPTPDTGDDGMPDRFLITHALTKDERNEDLKDFLQESIEECFQILDNENTEDKCEFSKNLWICLSEKGRANCDDWPKKSDFMF